MFTRISVLFIICVLPSLETYPIFDDCDHCTRYDEVCFGVLCYCLRGKQCDETGTYSAARLKPDITRNVKTYNSVTLFWNAAHLAGYTNSYVVRYRATGGTKQSHNVNGQHRSTVRNLSPGTTYTFTVNRHLRREGQRNSSTESDPYWVTTNGIYSDSCTAVGRSTECGSGLTCVSGSSGKMCLCTSGNYWNSSSCSSIHYLKPTIVSSSASLSSVSLSWTSPVTSGYTNRYVIKYRVNGQSTTKTIYDLQSATVYNLSPGTSYTFTVARYITRYGLTQSVPASASYRTSTKRDYGIDCSGEQCLNIFSCINGICLCADGSYYNTGSCNSTTALRPNISGTEATSTNTVTVKWNSPPANGYTNSFAIKYKQEGSSVAETSPVSGDVSTHIVTGLEAGTSYTFVVVRSITREERTQTVDSLPVEGTSEKIIYGGSCLANGTCKNLNTNCYSSSCRCNPGYYWTNDTCVTNTNLSPNQIKTETLSSTQVRVNWTSSPFPGVASDYIVELSPPVSSENITITGTSAIISSLTPGERYRITVSSVSRYLNRGETATADAVYGITKPAATPGIAPGTSLTEPVAEIHFYKAEGRADSYTVTLSRNGYSANTTTSGSPDTLSANFHGVSAGLYYNVTITTKSHGLSSDPYTQIVRVKAEASEAVVGLFVYDVTSRTASLSWKRPINTKGVLFKYTVEVFNFSVCVQRVSIQCRDCFNEMNVTESFEVSCENEMDKIISKSDLSNANFPVHCNMSTLLPHTTYDVTVAAYNEEGRGRTSITTVQTKQEAPRDPTELRFLSKTSVSVELMWTPPEPRPGITNYMISVYEWDEDMRQYIFSKNASTHGFYKVSINITGLSSYWNYRFGMYAMTIKGVSNSVDGPKVITDESAPIAVENLEHQPVDGVYNQYQLSWRCPSQKNGRNGVIRSATVITSTFNQLVGVNPLLRETTFDNSDCTWSEKITVTPEYNYTFEVYISNSMKGKSTRIQQYMQAGPPSFLTSERPVITVLSETEIGKSVELLLCPKCLLDNTNGVIIKSGILVCAKGNCLIRKLDEKTADDFDKSPNWDATTGVGFTTWYRATENDWLKGKEASDEIRFVLGGENCGVQDQNRFCNGPLQVDRTYRVWLFACNRHSCLEGDHVELTLAVNGDNTLPLPIIAATVTTAVIVVLAAIILLVVIKCIRSRSKRQERTEKTLDTNPDGNIYEEVGDGNNLKVFQDGRPEVDYYNITDASPRSENTYDELATYSNVGQHEYEHIKETQT